MKTEQYQITAPIRQRLEKIIGRIQGTIREAQGNTQSFQRLLIPLAGNGSVFAKIATDPRSADWLRHEYKVYSSVSSPHVARCLGWDDDGVQPILILEDLSQAHWPPPWNESHIRQVIEGLRDIASRSVPGLPGIEEHAALSRGWLAVSEQPEQFLSLGLVTDAWLNTALPELLEIDGPQVLKGDALLHLDIRSDNLCFTEGRAVFIDWNWACLGNPLFDLGAWLPSLESEGGPQPDTILPDGGEIAAVLSGYFASQAGLPARPNAERVRRLQLAQLKSALPWAIRALGLPAMDGRG